MADIFDSTFDDQYGQMHYWLNLSNAAGEQVELVAKQRDSQNPAIVRAADNRDLHPDTNGRVAPNLRDAINRDPGTAAYFKDELPKWDAAARKLFGMGAEDTFMQAVENEISSHALAVPNELFLSGKRRELYLNREGHVWDDTSSSRFFRSVVVRAAEEIQKAKVAETTDKLTRVNGIMRAFDMTLPGWRKGDDKQIRADLAHASSVLGIKTDDISPEELRETKGVDPMNAFDFFGWQEIAQAWNMVRRPYTPEDLVDVTKDSPLDLQLAKLHMLEEEREMLKESTWGERIVNGVLSSIPFVAEFAATGGIAGIAGRSPELAMKLVMRGMGWKMLRHAPGKFFGKAAKAAGIAALGAAKRIPMYLPKNMAQSLNEKYYGGSVTMPIGDGKLSVEVPEEKVANLFQGFISNMAQQYIENFSEDLGALVPYGDLDAKMIAGWFPKETRNAVIQKLAWTPSARRFMNRVVMDNVPFNGVWGEFAEEELGNMMSYFATALLETVGFDEDNTPGTKSLFMGGQESLDTLATIMLQSAGFRMAAAVSNNARGRGALGMIEAANRVKEQGKKMDEVSDNLADTNLVAASIPQAVQVVNNLRGGDVIMHIDAEDAGNVLYQAVEEDDKETLGALQECGITKDSVEQAKKKGDDLRVSQNLLLVLGTNKHYKTGRDVMHKLWNMTAESVFGMNVKDLTGSSFEKAQLERLTEQAEEDRKFMGEIRSIVFSSLKTAAKNAHDAGAEISNETAQNWASIISAIQNYIVGNTTEEGREEVKKMLTNLSIQFSENPATFDPKAARAQVDNLWTGSAADYDQPSLQYVGTGEGAQVYGWGLYASKSKDVAKWYAQNDVRRKGSSRRERIYLDGKLVEDPYADNIIAPIVNNIHNNGYKTTIQYLEREYERLRKPADGVLNLKAIERTKKFLDVAKRLEVKHDWMTLIQRLVDEKFMNKVWDVDSMSDEELLAKVKATFLRRLEEERQNTAVAANRMLERHDEKRAEFYIRETLAAEEAIRNLPTLTDGSKLRSKKHNLYKQTFWGGKEENLLDWEKPLPAKQKEQILDELVKERKGYEGKNLSDYNFRVGVEIRFDFATSGHRVYNQLVDMLRSPKAASEFLYRAGIDGVTYVGDSSGVRNYVAFSDKDIKVNEHIRYQKERAIWGQFDPSKFKESREAIITLFQKSNASTLPHESAHWLKTMMESLVEGGFGTPKMEEDLAAINRWLDKQDYKNKELAKEYGLLDKDGKVREDAMRDEFFARAFEAYIWEGKFPAGAEKGFKAALYRLGHLLRSIYLNAAGLNVQMDDSIRSFFNGLFAADYAVKEQSVLSDILRSINEGALAMSKAELADLEKAVAGVRDDAQMQAYWNALREYRDGERAMKPIWRKDAKQAYAESKAERALTYVKKGHKLDENFLRNVLKLEERDIEILKAKRLVVKGTKTPPTELTGDAEQFKNLPDDAVISLPADEAKAGDVLSSLVYGDTGRGGAIWKRAKTVKTPNDDNGLNWDNIQDSMTKGYEAAFGYATSGNPMTKADLIGAVASAAYNHIRSVWRENERIRNKGGVSLDASLENGEGDATTFGELIGGSQSVDYFGEEEEERENRLQRVSEWTDTFKDGTAKTVAEILYEFLESNNEDPSGREVYAEYKLRGGELPEKRINTVLSEVTKSLKAYLKKPFREQGIHTRFQTAASNVPASIMETMKELGYDDALRLIGDLKLAVGQKRFIEEYMARRAEEYKNDFINSSPLWQTETGVAEYLDAILKALKLTEGMKFSQRVRMEEAVAERELRERKVQEVMGSLRSLEMSLRTSAARVLKAVKNNKEDKAAATTAALSMHRHAAQLNAARKLQASVRRSMRSAERMGNAKQGKSIDGDFLNAILAVRNAFGMSRRQPRWTDGPGDPQSVGGVLRRYLNYIVETELGETNKESERHEKLYLAAEQFERERWSPELWSIITGQESAKDFRELTMKQFDELMDFLDFLDGAGRDIRGEEKASFGARVRDAVESIVKVTTAHNGKRTGQEFKDQKTLERLRALSQSSMNYEKTLVSLCDMLDGYSEHYGKHIIGPWRRKFQMLLSAGESRRLHWQQKISKDIRPHLKALMDSTRKRGLTVPVKNKITSGYTEIKKEQMTFILLNAGCVENRERLMSGFGWSEDELNDILKTFTAEDFKHAEAIWASLHEMGEQVAGVFFRDRHYRMPWSESVPIELTNDDGEQIVCAGGYYPIEYKPNTRNGETAKAVEMDENAIMAAPLPPSSTYQRQAHVDGHLLLDYRVLPRFIHDNARYIGMWEPLRFANAVWTNQAVKDAVFLNYGPETYDALKKLMKHANNPDNRELENIFLRWGVAILPTTALAFKLGPMLSQLQSYTVGAERLGRYFWHSAGEFLRRPVKMRRLVADKSPFMRDRYNQRERDLQDIGTEFDNGFIRTADGYRRLGFFGIKLLDLHVAGSQWWAAYNQALSNEANMLTPEEAAIYADDFVASTQGGARVVDMPVAQLNKMMKALTPFFGPAVAAFNSRMAVLSSLKKMSVGEAVEAVILTIIFPALLNGMKNGFLQGPSSGDDDDDWGRVQRGFIRGLLSDVTSGVPIVQDLSDAAIGMIQTKGNTWKNKNIFEASQLRPLNEAANSAFDFIANIEDNPEYSAYVGTALVSEALNVPFVSAYENWEKFALRHFGDSDDKTLKQTLKGGNKK